MPTTQRLDGLDAARGLAVVSMLVAHLSPTGGVLDLSEYLTAPLFAVIVGSSMGVRLTDRAPRPGSFLLDNLQRGLVLIILGVLLQALYSQIDVVLPYLGVLVIVLAPLALVLHRMPVLTVGIAGALAVVGPILVERVREAYPSVVDGRARGSLDVVTWLATGEHYRLVTFLPMALAGLALGTVLRRAAQTPEAYGIAAALVVLSIAAYALGQGTLDGAEAYSGTTAEVVGATFLATGTVVVSFLVVHLVRRAGTDRVLRPLLATGRLALTAYTVQILWLVLLATLRDNASDNAWWILGSTLVVVIGVCWACDRRWGTGPLEWVLHRLRPVPRPARHEGRH